MSNLKKIAVFILYHVFYWLVISMYWICYLSISYFFSQDMQTSDKFLDFLTGTLLFPIAFSITSLYTLLINSFIFGFFYLKKSNLAVYYSCFITSVTASYYTIYKTGRIESVVDGYLLFGLPAIILTVIYYKRNIDNR